MDNQGKPVITSTTTSGSGWPLTDLPDLSTTTLNSVFASEPIASNSDFTNYLQSLGDHDDPLLNPDDVASIKDIFKHEEDKIGREKHDQKSVDQSFDLGPDGLPSSFSATHVQSGIFDASFSSRPGHGVQGVLSRNDAGLPDALLEDIERMQTGGEPPKDKATLKKTAINEGLQKIKEQLGKSDKVITGPAVVTEFIDNSGIMFSDDLDETSKCSVDSTENALAKEFTISPRRSTRKTTRLFEIVGPNSKSKKGGIEKIEEDESRHLRRY